MRYNYIKYLTMISQIGLLMAIPIFFCVFVGIWLDERFGTNGLFLIIFILLGVMAAFRNLFVAVLGRPDKDKEEKKHDRH